MKKPNFKEYHYFSDIVAAAAAVAAGSGDAVARHFLNKKCILFLLPWHTLPSFGNFFQNCDRKMNF